MIENVSLNMQGHIEIYNGEELIFSEDNLILPESIEIILNALNPIKATTLDSDREGSYGINTLRVISGLDVIDKPITEVQVNKITKKIMFTTLLVENDFNGYINTLYLRNSILAVNFSSKTGLNIIKDDNMRLKINWTITINKV